MNTTTDYFALQELELQKKLARERRERQQVETVQAEPKDSNDADRSARPLHDTRAR